MKTSELTGAALDWAVAKCEGEIVETREASYVGPVHALSRIERETSMGYVRMKPKLYILKSALLKKARRATEDGDIQKYRWCDWWYPSTDWAQGGPIIEREWIDLHCVNDSLWEAECPAPCGLAMQNGPTPLIAAMRCYVASKLGADVDVPEELCPPTA